MFSINADLSQPTCRVCLQNQDEEMSSIFDVDADFNDLHIYEKIEQCAGIEIIRHEKIPTLICSDCYGFLKVSYKFRTICRNSNEYLKEFVVNEKSIPPIEEGTPPHDNLQLEAKNTSRKRAKRSHSKTIAKRKVSSRPQTIKEENDVQETIKCEFVSGPNSPVNSEDQNGEHLDDDDMWFDPHYQEDEDFDISVDSIELNVNEESDYEPEKKKKPNKRKKTVTKKAKKGRKPSKTLEISSDGAAIIRERKPRAKKEKQLHICDVCGNIYQRRYGLELHMRRHRDEKPYECELCSHAFHSNFELIRHMRKHTGSRPYKCSYCPRAFGDQSTLIKHERIHRNERPFKCDTCGKSFTYSNVLKSHILTHTGEKPYTCELCGKCFTRAHHLRAHLETLQHQSDPRSKILLQNIRPNNEGETLKIKNNTVSL